MINSIHYQNYQVFIFLGIGGIGMSALARYLLLCGKMVKGYDQSSSEITISLEAMGADISQSALPKDSWFNSQSKEDILVIWTPAIAKNNPWMVLAKSHNLQMVKRAELLGSISCEAKKTFAVAGTHGKTTTSSLLTHIMVHSGQRGIGFLGGIAQNYQSNLILGDGVNSLLNNAGAIDFSVVEADEFDRSFHYIAPDIACVTSMDPDHLDIYENSEAFVHAFEIFIKDIDSRYLFINDDLEINGISVGLSPNAEIWAENIYVQNGTYRFDLNFGSEVWQAVTGPLPGRHNLCNTIMAISMARAYGISEIKIKEALVNFKGVHRRFNRYELGANCLLIDDYAHHPTELSALLRAIREFYPNRNHVLLFQPHLFSRTRDFCNDFAEILKKFDRVVLMPIYPARELPLDGINSDWLADLCKTDRVISLKMEQALEAFVNHEAEIYIMAGAGDIGAHISEIKLKLRE